MKKTLLIAALSVAAVPAMASKARLNALNNPGFTADIQDVFANPAKATQHGEWLTFEMGSTATSNATAADTHAEGGFARSMGDARWGFYLGHNYSMVTDVRDPNGRIDSNFAAVGYEATALASDNTVNLFYGTKAGDLAWGAGLGYSKTDKKTSAIKADLLAVTGGVVASSWDAGLTLIPMNNYKDESTTVANTRDLKGTLAWDLSGNYYMDDMTYFAGASMNGAKVENGSGTELNKYDFMRWNVGAEKNAKVDGGTFFYGAKYTSDVYKDKASADAKLEVSKLPIYAGIEADANSWLVLRGSIQQNFVLGSTQITKSGQTGTQGDKDTIANDTTVNAGAGLKFGKLMIDGQLTAQTGGASAATAAINGSNLLYNGSLTYNF